MGVPSVIDLFFGRCKNHMHLLRHIYADFFFKGFINGFNKKGAYVTIPEKWLYCYDQMNPNGVTKQAKACRDTATIILNNLWTYTMSDDPSWKKGVKGGIDMIPPQYVKNLFPEKRQIEELCKILY